MQATEATIEYNKKFLDETKCTLQQSERDEAYRNALDVRKFEIQLFWTRANYFFLFVSAAFAAYGVVLGWKPLEIAISEKTKLLILLLIAGIGFLVSLAWYLANKGGKFWQENWEHHVDLLESGRTGHLFRTVLSKKRNGLGWLKDNSTKQDSSCNLDKAAKFFSLAWLPIKEALLHPSKSYPYSPSKVNIILSASTTVIFFIIFLGSFFRYQGWLSSIGQYIESYSGYGVFFLIMVCGLGMILSCRSSTEDIELQLYSSYRTSRIKENLNPVENCPSPKNSSSKEQSESKGPE